MEIPLLRDIVIIFGLSILVLLGCHRLRIPSLVGFLITGIICGPEGFGLVRAGGEVKVLAEIGIVILLFSVGLEFSVKNIIENIRVFLLAGPLQVAITTIFGFFVGQVFGRPIGESIFLGFIISLSSTAIVMRILQERAEMNSPHGKIVLGILIFQDIIVVPMMLITPLLGSGGADLDLTLIWLLAKGFIILALTFVSAVQFVPSLLFHVAKTRSRELFILTVFVICFGVAWITSSIGLSLALGAFLAGLIISESEFSHRAIGDFLPFQDIFTSFFFVSIGMLLDMKFFIDHPFIVLVTTVAIFVLKSIIISGVSLLIGVPLRIAVQAGLSLSQVGEFSFVLASYGIIYGIGTEFLHELFLAVAIITMGITPYVISYSPKIAQIMFNLPFSQSLKSGLGFISTKPVDEVKEHVIIIGFGFSGRNLARSSREANVPYVVIDMNPETVREEGQKGEPITFGDATRERVLKHANIKDALVVAILINDSIAALRVVEQARRLNPSVFIVVRTRYLQEMRALYQLGADEVIPDELGSTVEIFSRVLMRYRVPTEKLEQLVDALRTEGYEMIRPRYGERTVFSDLKEYLEDVGVQTVAIRSDSPLAGQKLEECNLRKKWGLTVIVIKRDNKPIYHIDAATTLEVGDQVVLIGTKEKLSQIGQLFNP